MRYGEDDEQKLLYSSQIATTLAYLVVEQSDRVSLTTFDNKTRGYLPPSNNMGQIIRMTESLDQVKSVNKTNIARTLGEVSAKIGRRSIVVVISDFFVEIDDLEDALQRLRYDNHEVVLMHVMHKDELQFDMDGMIRFIGLEDPDQLLTRPHDIRDAYLEAVEKFMVDFQTLCDANRCEYVLCDTSRDLGATFAQYLQQRSQAGRL